MAFQPDILVTTPEGVMLVVEAKVILPNLSRTEEDLKEFMVRMQCPIGLLITPERMWLYRDFYTTGSRKSVERIGEFNVTPLWPKRPPSHPGPFEMFVQQWLEDLVTEQPYKDLPKELREALREYVMPAVARGEVRAAHPR